MISRINALVIAVALFFCSPLIRIGHAQQAQIETQAVQVIGLAGLKENTKGRLTVVNGTLRFVYANGNADVAAASIEERCHGKGQPASYRRHVRNGGITRCSLRVRQCAAFVAQENRHPDDSISRRGRRPARRDLYDAAGQGGSDQEGTGRTRSAHKRSDSGGLRTRVRRFARGDKMRTNFRNAQLFSFW